MPARKIFVSPKALATVTDEDISINPEIIGDGFTQSEMQCWDDCPELWYLKYNQMLYERGKFSWALAYGGWIHGALEEFYSTGGKRWSLECAIRDRKFIHQDVLAKEDYWTGVADVQMQAYASMYKRDAEIWEPIALETVADVTFQGVRLKGMIDKVARFLPDRKAKKSIYIWDHKTTYLIDKKIVMGWDFRFQFMFYCWLATKIEAWKEYNIVGFVPNAIRKPALKWNSEKESLPSFLQRLQVHMQEEPEKYWYRDKLSMTKGALDNFEKNILGPKLDRIRTMLDPKTPPAVKRLFMRNKNTNHCISKFGTVCEFLPACQHGLSVEKFRYRRREVKHQELITETPEE